MAYKIKIQKKDALALLFVLFTQSFYMMQGTKLYSNTMRIMVPIAIICGFFYLVGNRITNGNIEKVLLSVFAFLMLIAFFRGRDTRILIAAIAIYVGINTDEKKLVSWLFHVRLFLLGIAVLAGGYHHPNTLAMHAGITLLVYFAYKGYKANTLFAILFFSIFAAWTKSGAFIVCMGLACLLFTLIRWKSVQHILNSKPVAYCFPIALALNLLSALLINQSSLSRIGLANVKIPEWLQRTISYIDYASTSRISLAQYSIDHFGISFWGGNIDYSKLEIGLNGYFNLDSGLMWLLQGLGIILTILYMIITVYLVMAYQKNSNYYGIIIALTIALWSMNEDMLLSVGFNILYFFVGRAILDFKSRRTA